MSNELIIVTNRCYIIAERIHAIYLSEHTTDAYGRRNKSDNIMWSLDIWFVPVSSGNNRNNGNNGQLYAPSNDVMQMQIMFSGIDDALAIHKEVVSQIREQMPDKLWLSKIMDNFLSEDNIINETGNARNAKVLRTRKKKKRSKKVLRRT